MAPKVVASAAIGRNLRSASKALNSPDGSKALTNGTPSARSTIGSKAGTQSGSAIAAKVSGPAAKASPSAKVLATIAKKSTNVGPAKNSNIAGGAAKPSSGNHPSVPASKAGEGIPQFSPLRPVQLAKAAKPAGGKAAAKSKFAATNIMEASYSSLFTMLAIKVPSIKRFSDRWNEIGESMTGKAVVMGYDPSTFTADLIQDLSTVSNVMDRPTAGLLFEAVVDYVKSDAVIPFAKRSEWVRAHCNFVGADVPPPYDDETVSRYAAEDAKLRHEKRQRIPDSVQSKRVAIHNSDSESDDNEHHALDYIANAPPPLTEAADANSVWGVSAGFAVESHEDILELHKATADDVARRNVNSAKSATITWPSLNSWDKEAWVAFDKQWWDCLVRAAQVGLYSKPVSLIKLALVNDIRIDLQISSSEWYRTTEVNFIRKAYGHFGPKNKEEALALLKTARCTVYSANISPDAFLKVLSTYNSEFLRVLDLQIAPTVHKWPKPGEPKHGPLTLKTIRDAFKDGFAACKDKSVSCEHCFNVCKQNPDLSHQDLYIELRHHFQEDSRALERATLKGRASGGGAAPATGGRTQNGGRGPPKPSYGGSTQRSNGGSTGGGGGGGQRRPPGDHAVGQFKVVAGKDRCETCGDYTNHYGHGSKNCPVAGTKFAKPKGYKWKDSDKEPKVDVPNKEYGQLKKDKATLFQTNATNRIAYRAKFTSKSEHYSSSADFAFLELSDAQPDFDADSLLTFTTHDGCSYNDVPPASEVLVDVVQMGNRHSVEGSMSLEDLGYSERFFGVAKFLPSSCELPTVLNHKSWMLCFSRNVTSGRYKRAPRCMSVRVDSAAKENLISAKALAHTSEYGKLKICSERKSPKLQADPRSQVLLEFCVGSANANTSSGAVQAWFTVDGSIGMHDDVVVVTSDFAQTHGITVPTTTTADIPAIVEHQSAIGRVFFDSGAQMSCISPHLVLPALCVNRAKVNVKVMQGVHDAGQSTEAVQLCFDLFDNQMVATRYVEWFLVWDNPYGVILGDSFCEQFTSWKRLLASWSSAETKAKFDVPATFTNWKHFREPSKTAAEDKSDAAATFKRAKTDTSHLRSKHPVTGALLKHRNAGTRPIIQTNDHLNYVPFDGLRPAGLLHESARRLDQFVEAKVKEKHLRTILHALPKDLRCSFDMAEMQNRFAKDQRSMCLQIMHDIAGLPKGLMMGTGAAGIVRRSALFEPMVAIPLAKDEIVTPEIAAQTDAERYLLRRADAAEWQWFDDDDRHYEELRKLEHVPLGVRIKPSPLTDSQKYTVNWLIKAANHTGKNQLHWTAEQDRVVREMDQRATVAVAATEAAATSSASAPPTTAPAAEETCYRQGIVIKFKDCVRLPEFNGKLGRLYELCSPDDDRWKIRVLGRNHGQFVIASARNFELNAEQKSFTSSADANFHDVGINDGGMPIEDDTEAPKPVHRQFGKEYSAELTKRIKEVLARYPQLFDGDISTPCDFDEMDIRLKPNAILPSKARYYRNTPLMREEVRRQIQEQLDAGIISKMPTAVVSNVLMVKRPHMPGRYRFVIDYRTVNEATVPDVLMMPDVKTQHDRLANKKIFGALDITSYYRLIKLKASCRYLTGFATEDGTYVYNRVPMGVRNACSHAQRVLQDKLAEDPVLGVNGANIRNYFDDIAWGSDSEDEFISVLTALMEFGVRHSLKYNIEKSCFGVDSITHVGFIADKDGIRIDPERTRDIVNLEAPKSTAKVMSILGTLNFVRNFLPNFSVKAKFLTDRLEKSAVKRDAGKKFTWTPTDEANFAELKSLVASAPLLRILDYSRDIYIRCDSSRYGAGAVLFQYDGDGREMPVCYASRKYTPTETRYSTFQQEMGCVVWALERFQEYTMGYRVIVETDHRNISFVKRSAMPQLARWRMRLEAFDFDVHYRCGALQQVADGLSRSACDDDGVDAVAVHYGDVIPECALANATPAESLKLVSVEELNVDYEDADLAASWAATVAIDPVDAVLPDADDDDAGAALLPDDHDQELPPLPWHDAAAVKTIIDSVHNDVAGHGGVLVTLQRLLKRGKPDVSRKQMLRDIDDYLRGCVGCQKMRKRTTGSATTRRVISGSPFSDLSVDILKLPFPDAYGNLYAVIIVDNFSHWVTAYACANKSAISAARALIHFIGTFGVPLRIRSDGGGEFCNDIVKQFAHMVDFKQIVIQPYLHSANGIVERVNRSVLEKLRFILFDRRIKKLPNLQWTDLLPFAQRIVNASTHSAIGTSPARIIFGDNVDLDRCILSRPPKDVRDKAVPEYVHQLSSMQAAMLEAANDHQLAVQQKVIAKAERENRDKPVKSLQCGDLVLVKPLSDFPHDKLAPSQLGPLYVIDVLPGGLVKVENPHSRKQATVSDFQCELFDSSLTSSIEGLKKVAETDGFEFAVDGIMAHGLQTGDDDVEPTALPTTHVRRLPAKNYSFLIKWTGYEVPTWIAFKAARRLPHFNNYVSQFPSLKINEQS